MAYLNYTKKQLSDLFAFYGNKCLACGSPKVTIDHIVPTHEGGLDVLENIQPLCLSCNSRKSLASTDYRPIPYPVCLHTDNPIVSDIAKFIFRLSVDLYARLEQDAKSNNRSMNSQLIQILNDRYQIQSTVPDAS